MFRQLSRQTFKALPRSNRFNILQNFSIPLMRRDFNTTRGIIPTPSRAFRSPLMVQLSQHTLPGNDFPWYKKWDAAIMKIQMDEVRSELKNLGGRVERNFDKMDSKFNKIDRKFERSENKMDV